MDACERLLTPPQLAKRWGVKVTKVHAWIRSGELRAMNFATKATMQARYKIRPEDVTAFEEARSSVRETKPSYHPRSKRRPPKVFI